MRAEKTKVLGNMVMTQPWQRVTVGFAEKNAAREQRESRSNRDHGSHLGHSYIESRTR